MADKPPAMRDDLRKALQAQIQDLIGGEEVNTHQFMKVAEVARLGGELSRALAVRPEKHRAPQLGIGGYGGLGGVTIGPSLYEATESGEDVPNAPGNAETFGATMVREFISTIREHMNRPSLGALINGIAAAREHGMTELAEGLQHTLSGMVDGGLVVEPDPDQPRDPATPAPTPAISGPVTQ